MTEAFERAAAQLAEAAARGAGGYVTVGGRIDGGPGGRHVLMTIDVPQLLSPLEPDVLLDQCRQLLRETLEANRGRLPGMAP